MDDDQLDDGTAVASVVGRDTLLRLDWIGTIAFAVTAVAATIAPDEPVVWVPAVTVALVLFGAGCVAFLLAFARAVERSRFEAIGIGGLYFLAGTAPDHLRRGFRTALAVQVVVGLVTASIRVFTSLAFGVLVPMWGLGLAGLWAARFGVFDSRTPEPKGGRSATQGRGRGSSRNAPDA